MTLVTTAGASDADSYGSVAEADAYFTARGVAEWTGTSAVKEAALRRAATYLDNQYRGRWKGYRSEQAQALAWPRTGSGDPRSVRDSFVLGITDIDGYEIPTTTVPTQIKHAQFEAALLVLAGKTLEPRLERGGRVKSKTTGVGPLSKSVTYMDGAPAIDRYMVIEGLLTGLVTSKPGAGVGNVALVRS